MSQRFSPTAAQHNLARDIERANLTSYSQVIKAFQRRDDAQIKEWKEQLQALQMTKETLTPPVVIENLRIFCAEKDSMDVFSHHLEHIEKFYKEVDFQLRMQRLYTPGRIDVAEAHHIAERKVQCSAFFVRVLEGEYPLSLLLRK